MTEFAVALERHIPGPRSKVFRAWLDPAVLARWMGPDGFSVVTADVDERVGGIHRIEMLDSDGAYHTFDSVIDELVPDERIVLTFRFHWDAEDTTLTLSFDDADDGGTLLRLAHERIPSTPPLTDQSVDTGWSQTLAKLHDLFTGPSDPADPPEQGATP